MFAKKHFRYSGAHNSKSKCCYNAKPSPYYFYVKTKIPIDFYICISVPLTTEIFIIINRCGINYCGTYFCNFGSKSQKYDPQNTVLDKSIAKIISAKYGLKANHKNEFCIPF